MKYERLTMVNNGFIDTNCRSCKQCKKVGRKYICNDMTACNEEIITRLAELEDKIENGTLIELPCKVGTPVYYIVGVTTRKILKQKSDYYITKTRFFIDMLENYQNNWFLTKAEAEMKLKELKGE